MTLKMCIRDRKYIELTEEDRAKVTSVYHAWQQEGYEAVSYTHLDVYKRQVHKYARNEDGPEHTLFVITTDGMENASRRYDRDVYKRQYLHRRPRMETETG